MTWVAKQRLKQVLTTIALLILGSGCHSTKFVGEWTSKCSTIFAGAKSCSPESGVFQTKIRIFPDGTFKRSDNGNDYLSIEKGKWSNSIFGRLSFYGEEAKSMPTKSIKFDKMPRSTRISETSFGKASAQQNGAVWVTDEMDLKIIEDKVYESELNGFAKTLGNDFVEEFVRTEEIVE